MKLSRTLMGLLCAVGTACSGSAMAQAFPNKPIRIITPAPAGSAAETITRILANSASRALGQSIVVEGKPGADGAIAGLEVVKAAPDGYTLLLGTGGPIASIGAFRKNPPYDPIKDLTPIADVGRFTIFLYSHPELPVNNFAELVAYAKAHPKVLTYATGNASGLVTFAQMNFLAGGLEMVHVPYKAEGPAVIDLVAGRVQLMWATPTAALSFVKTGKLRALATQLKRRSTLLPDVPTLGEVGLSKFSITSFAAIYGPARMPADVVNRLSTEFQAAMARPDVIADMEKQAFVLTPGSPADLAKLTEEQVVDFARMSRQAGIVPE